MRRAAAIIASAMLLVAIYAAIHRHGTRAAPDSRLAAAPDLAFTDLSGHRFTTADYKGKVVLVNFWAAWCTSCNEEIPRFVALQNKYQGQGLQTVGISMDDAEGELRSFYQKFRMNYPVVAGDQKVASAYGGVLGLPTTILIGRDGHIHARYAGLADFPQVEQEIVALLQRGQ